MKIRTADKATNKKKLYIKVLKWVELGVKEK